MTTIGMTRGSGRTMATPARSGSTVRQVLLACGILSSLLYVATDVLGGMRYEGYSFTSQAISELMAIGAPSEALVDPLFITYGVLALAFGVGVFREGAGRSRAMRITGALLIGYAAIGFMGPTFFEMHQRGAGGSASDAPHVVLTGALVLLTLLAIGFGAFALGTRFRVYSFATLLTVVVLGALTAPYGARLAAGQPTPGFGIVERVNIYSSMAWVAVLAIALLRRPRYRAATTASGTMAHRASRLAALRQADTVPTCRTAADAGSPDRGDSALTRGGRSASTGGATTPAPWTALARDSATTAR
jgi:hypothetical membrane protein